MEHFQCYLIELALSGETKACWLGERFQIVLVASPETFAMILQVLAASRCAKLIMKPAEINR